jgi:hypothetical protein
LAGGPTGCIGFIRWPSRQSHLPLRTRDADVAFSTDVALRGNLRKALSVAGFREELFGDDTPPVTHYRLGEEDAGFYAEFLTPLHGGGLKRTGAPDATVSKAGITAQKMRYLDLLLVAPWSVRVGSKLDVSVAAEVDVLVPNPTSFIVQKLLIHPARPPHKKAQDLLYIHDTLARIIHENGPKQKPPCGMRRLETVPNPHRRLLLDRR